jgi:predicted metal-dependent HD superfamily phosphohydrolase
MAMDEICLKNLKSRWQTLLPVYMQSSEVVWDFFEKLKASYASPNRFYHNLDHLCHVFDLLTQANIQDEAVFWAVFYHDYIYVAGSSSNEEKSADIAINQLVAMEVPLITVERCAELILLTRNHKLPRHDDTAAAFLDADMAILGSSASEYEIYIANIRKEYSSIPEFLYKSGRKKFLKTCLDQPAIFNSEWFFKRFEKQARKNLNWELTITG